MLKYIFKRLLLFLPTLLIISLVTFWLGKIAPGDPLESLPGVGGMDNGLQVTSGDYDRAYKQYGLDKALFYFSFTALAQPDTMHRIPGRYRQESLSKLVDQYGNWELIQNYSHSLEDLCTAIEALPAKADKDTKIDIRRSANQLLEMHKDIRIESKINSLSEKIVTGGDTLINNQLTPYIRRLSTNYTAIKQNPKHPKRYIPVIYWHGADNQYHHWVSSFLKGNFGLSYRSGQPVIDRIRTPIYWTLIINLISITLVYLLSVPLGVFSAVKKDSLSDKIITTILFILYSLPTFWIGTMLLVFFTNPEYGMNWFEGAGLGNLPSSAPFWDRFWETARHLILPVFCVTYGALAFMSRQVRGGMIEVLNQDYIRTARAKGLSTNTVVWKHSFRNALFPLITIFARIFPAAIAGSIIIEQIFNIPGMGRELLTSISSKDWPVLYTIVMLVAVLTMFGNLIADMLFAFVDPRVKF